MSNNILPKKEKSCIKGKNASSIWITLDMLTSSHSYFSFGSTFNPTFFLSAASSCSVRASLTAFSSSVSRTSPGRITLPPPN